MRVGNMKTAGIFCRQMCLCLVIFLGSLLQAHSQDLFRDMDQVKRDLSSLRNEVSQLRNSLEDLRKMVLRGAASQSAGRPETIPGAGVQAATQEPIVDDREITRVACQAVGKFFEEADASLRTSDETAAAMGMRAAMRRLNSSLRRYAGTQRISKLLNIYDGLSYDLDVAVGLRGSIQGNQGFMDALNEHRRKYRETCEQK